MFELREWQKEALARCGLLEKSIVEACPGSGKSAFSGALAKMWLDSGSCNHVLAVAPSVSIKRSIMRQWANNFGLRVRGGLSKSSSSAFRLPTDYDATVITYHELKNEVCEDILKLWVERSWPFGVVFDEIHHAAESQTWGDNVRTIGHDLASRVCIMTGTAFRSDGQPIELMQYVARDGETVANPDYSYVYRQAVNDDICRPVTCQWIEGPVTFSAFNRGIYTKSSREVTAYERNEANRLFFDPAGETMEKLVKLVHSDLMRLRDREEYSDAAALFVCRPGEPNKAGEGEESAKHVKAMAKLIERITKREVVVVTHDEDDGADKLDAFAKSNAPYLVAVNMVSEGVDIPRLRMAAFCRYTESEMLFRQIAGRTMRKTMDNDGVASQIYVPAIYKMIEFGQRLYDEAKAGLRDRPVKEKPIPASDDESDLVYPESKKIIGIDAAGDAGGGQFGETSVEPEYIGTAKKVMMRNSAFRHGNAVQFGAFLKTANELSANEGPANVSVDQFRDNLCARLRRRICLLARVAWHGDYGKAWNVELFDRYKVSSLDDIKTLWADDQIKATIEALEQRIDAVAHNRGI